MIGQDILHAGFERITVDSAVAAGKPCIRDLRFPVSACSVCWLPWETKESILSASPYLEEADIDEALSYAPCLLEDETIELRR
jgi:uncharacterized protein (DUF433 family)